MESIRPKRVVTFTGIRTLEVLRLTRQEYARPLLDQDVVVQCTAYWRPLQRKQWLKGDIRGLYERRVGDLGTILTDD